MTLPIETQLASLHAEPSPAVARFDDGPALGHTVVVLPSAFNPPTVAHLELMFVATQYAAATGSLALLTTRNVDKGIYGAGLADRVRMLIAAREDGGDFAIGASNQARIMDQAEALRRAFPRTDFHFVVGFDTLERLFAPRYYTDMERELRDFFGRHRVFAANRGATGPQEVADWIQGNAGRFGDAVEVLEIDASAARMSSTDARDRAARGEPAEELTAAVSAYIRKAGLYRNDTGDS